MVDTWFKKGLFTIFLFQFYFVRPGCPGWAVIFSKTWWNFKIGRPPNFPQELATCGVFKMAGGVTHLGEKIILC